MKIRVGTGFDAHAFGPGDSVALGGIRVPHTRGVVAHSDGDVILHALCDALLGAAGLGDIGQHFPDTDARWKGADSSVFVTEVFGKLRRLGYEVGNVDLTLLAQGPRIAGHREAIRRRVASLLGLEDHCVNLKATTTEYLGFIGRSEGIAALATVLITSSSALPATGTAAGPAAAAG
jgi:2-C-methyl-D-erythritol 2,4-cyclodiphosphate synthase